MSARQANQILQQRLINAGISASFEDANTLRRAELTLQRWAEQECGNSNDFCSFSIERDEETGVPYRCTYPHTGTMRKYPIADRERGALKRVKAVCERLGVHFYHQGDPRGCALYVSVAPVNGSDYSRGIACCE